MTIQTESLPDVLTQVRTKPLFQLRDEVPPLFIVGATPNAFRRIRVVVGGSFEGERLSGKVVCGNDWQDVRRDNCTKLDARLLLKANDDSLIVMKYQCLRAGEASVLAQLDRGEPVDPASYYLRFIALFETSAPKYGWINRIVALGVGSRLPDGPLYNVFEVL
jgi:hypothetical protein